MANMLEMSGAQASNKQPKYAPLFLERTFKGLYTQRSALHDASDIYTAKYFGGAPDALWLGSNIELTNRLTLQRRPGLSPFSCAVYPTPPDRSFSFELLGGQIQVLVDTASSGSLSLSSVATSSGGTAVYTGVMPGGANNAFAGLSFTITGFGIPSNNGTYIAVASTATTLTLLNATAVAESFSVGSYEFIQAHSFSAAHSASITLVNSKQNLMVLVAYSFTGDRTPPTITDTLGNTWNYLGFAVASSNIAAHYYYAFNIAGGSNTITAVDPFGTFIVCMVSEYAGFGAANPLTQTVILEGTANLTTTTINSLVWNGQVYPGPGVFNPSTNLPDFIQRFADTFILLQDQFVANSGVPIVGNSSPGVSAGGAAQMLATFQTGGAIFGPQAVSAGAVYVDNQSASGLPCKTLLFAKSPGAGQGYFLAVGGVLYYGNGVDLKVYTGTGVFNFGSSGPATGPGTLITSSGSAAVQWAANTFWSTMGLVFDTTTGTVFQLQSVNVSLINNTQFGTSGNGQPAWNNTPGGSTLGDGTENWLNRGPIVLWTANTVYANQSIGGTLTNPCAIYDPITKTVQTNSNPGNNPGTSGALRPTFKSTPGQFTTDGGVKWECYGPISAWKPLHTYIQYHGLPDSAIAEPTDFSAGFPATQTVWFQTAEASPSGTTGAGGTTPFQIGSVAFGTPTTDNDLSWLSLGSYTWAPTFSYSAWSTNGAPFSVIKDTNGTPGNFQVCTTTGISSNVEPGTVSPLASAANAIGGNTTYTGAFAATLPVMNGSAVPVVVISGFANPGNNGTFVLVSSNFTTITVANPGGVAEAAIASSVYNPWGVGYGGITNDGTVVWTCVGIASPWAANIKWFLPAGGFSPPGGSSSFGGASVIDSNNNVEFIVNSGLGGAVHPVWAAVGFNTADPLVPNFVVASVAVTAGIATYTGTFTGGGGGTFNGQAFLIGGFPTAGNNKLINVLISTATTLTCVATSQVNEATGVGTASHGAIWFNLEVFNSAAQSLAFLFGFSYSYAYKARTLTDFYSVNVPGTSQPPIPPGLTAPLPPPTGSMTGAITTASPATVISGSNTGAVITISGVGSTDPQYDTIVIYRSADSANGSGSMFELTEIPMPLPLGSAGPWTFRDFLPSVPTTINGVSFPGLNPLFPAPINEQNNPPPAGFLPMVYNFQRIWGVVKNEVFFSGGPDVVTGNPNFAFNPADEFPFLTTVIRVVKTSLGLIIFLTDSIDAILGGPATSSFYAVTISPGMGLANFNALDQLGGEIYFFSADNKLRVLSPTLSITDSGFAIGDLFANMPSSGVADAFWDSKKVWVAIHQNGTDSCIFVADGSTGWYRLNAQQVNGTVQGQTGPVWSPFANIVGGAGMVQSIETAPGIKKLLVGAPSSAVLPPSIPGVGGGLVPLDSVVILAGSTITNTGASVITGDVSLSPGTSVTGFPPGVITGIEHIADATALQDQIDLTAAYTALVALVPVTVPTELGGTTKTAGTYTAASGTFQITGTLTLDGAGDPNSVFVFQTASTLITATSSVVMLINGAQAKNVFWQVGSSATIAISSVFIGTIMAQVSITVNTSASVTGKLLARTGAVTLDTNAITNTSLVGTPPLGGGTGGHGILFRDLTAFTDNGAQYDAFFVMGSLMLVHPGQISLLKFLEMDFNGISYRPVVSYLLNEIAGTFIPFTLPPQFDPPQIYGNTIAPISYSPNRYYFSGTGSLARCRHMQIKVDFGTTPVGNEIFNLTVYGRLVIEG